MFCLQSLREWQSIVWLWFYFSDDVTLNTFHVPFVIFTSKNDAFLQIHFSPISHNLMAQRQLPAWQRGCRARPHCGSHRQTHMSTWSIQTALGALFIPDALLASCPNPFAAGPGQETRELQFHQNKPQTETEVNEKTGGKQEKRKQ